MENQRVLAAKQFIKNQTKKASDYFKPTEKVRARDVIRELPGAVAQTFSGTRDTVVKGGKILGEGLAYATSPNVRKMYQAGNTDILPTVSNTTPRQMLANTAKSAFEIAPVGKIKGLATAAMSAKLLPRVLAGGAMGYGYDVADKMSRPEPVSQSTFHPGIATLAGALFGGMSRPTSEMLGQAGREIGDDVRNINPANRLSHKIVDKYDYEPVPGVFAPGGIQQQRPIMESFRKEVETTQMPYNPQSSIARFLMGKQKVGMGIEPQNPLLQEAGKYKSAEEFVKAQGTPIYHGTTKKFDEYKLPATYEGGRARAVFFAENKKLAEKYAYGKGNVKENILDPSAKIFDYTNPEHQKIVFDLIDAVDDPRSIIPGSLMSKEGLKKAIQYGDYYAIESKAVQKLLKKKGFDGFTVMDYGNKAIGITNTSKIKTKSQLTDLYNKAQGVKSNKK